jgi:hypothetical protein
MAEHVLIILASGNSGRHYHGRWTIYSSLGTGGQCGSKPDRLSYLAESRGSRKADMGAVAECSGTMSLWRLCRAWLTSDVTSMDNSGSGRMAVVVGPARGEDL